MAAVAVLGAALAGCGGHRPAQRSAPTTTLVQTDAWTAPAVSGPPSTTSFCTLLVAAYRHMAILPDAANLGVRQQIVGDYVRLAPTMIGAAPPVIAPAARAYIGAVTEILADLNKVGLQSSKLPPGQLGPILLDPKIKAAGNDVIAFSQRYCHYTIGS